MRITLIPSLRTASPAFSWFAKDHAKNELFCQAVEYLGPTIPSVIFRLAIPANGEVAWDIQTLILLCMNGALGMQG